MEAPSTTILRLGTLGNFWEQSISRGLEQGSSAKATDDRLIIANEVQIPGHRGMAGRADMDETQRRDHSTRVLPSTQP